MPHPIPDVSTVLGKGRHDLFGEQLHRLDGMLGLDETDVVIGAEDIEADALVLLQQGYMSAGAASSRDSRRALVPEVVQAVTKAT